jgi:hypothetical protein
MAVGSQQYAITSAAAVIAATPSGTFIGPGGAVWLTPDSTNDVFIGGTGVTVSTGFKILHGTAQVGPFTLYSGDVLYAVTATTATLGVLQT